MESNQYIKKNKSNNNFKDNTFQLLKNKNEEINNLINFKWINLKLNYLPLVAKEVDVFTEKYMCMYILIY